MLASDTDTYVHCVRQTRQTFCLVVTVHVYAFPMAMPPRILQLPGKYRYGGAQFSSGLRSLQVRRGPIFALPEQSANLHRFTEM